MGGYTGGMLVIRIIVCYFPNLQNPILNRKIRRELEKYDIKSEFLDSLVGGFWHQNYNALMIFLSVLVF